ncbi:MAG: hypothetical protein Q9219_003552 [cf. Caloplaca sp. 3 TL-2023]
MSDSEGMDSLTRTGWLFKVEDAATSHGSAPSWVYWELFDFHNVKMSALKSATTNIVLVVVIGVLNLPVYVPALGHTLRVPIDMDHEFLGQGAANILAGLAGTVPNILQLSYSLFFTRAGGGRFEAAIVTLLTFGFLFISSHVLPYVPTILASALVLFLGIELTLEAVWESAKTLVLVEWLVVMATLLACTFLGYAPGFGVGVAAAATAYLLWGVVDTRARVDKLDEEVGLMGHQSSPHMSGPKVQKSPPSVGINGLGSKSSFTVHEDRTIQEVDDDQIQATPRLSQESKVSDGVRIRVIKLSGYIFFATIPSLESTFKDIKQEGALPYDCIILDLTHVCRVETCVAEFLERLYREIAGTRILLLAGVVEKSAVFADLKRGGLESTFARDWHGDRITGSTLSNPLVFEDLAEATRWCHHYSKSERHPGMLNSDVTIAGEGKWTIRSGGRFTGF